MKNFRENSLKFVLPAFAFVFIFEIMAMFITVIMSFTNYTGIQPTEFIGLENYVAVFSDPNFALSIVNTLAWVVGGFIINFILPLVMAIGIYNSCRPKLFKTIFYLPNVMAGVGVALMMKALLGPSGIPSIFEQLGVQALAVDWISVPYFNTFAMILSTVWAGIGLNMLLFLVALNALPRDYIEAARIDGAGGLKLYTKIIIPTIKPTIIVVLLMTIVNSLKSFDTVWMMSKGGPYRSSETLAVNMYTTSFVEGNMGEGAAIAVILSVFIVAVAGIIIYKTMKEER